MILYVQALAKETAKVIVVYRAEKNVELPARDSALDVRIHASPLAQRPVFQHVTINVFQHVGMIVDITAVKLV